MQETRQALSSLGKPIVITSISFNLICLSRSNLSPSSEYSLFQYAEQIVCSSAKRTKSLWKKKGKLWCPPSACFASSLLQSAVFFTKKTKREKNHRMLWKKKIHSGESRFEKSKKDRSVMEYVANVDKSVKKKIVSGRAKNYMTIR